jgi:multiple sugar transport system permease protein
MSAGRALTYVALVVWSAVSLLPLYWLAVTSLKDAAAITGTPVYLPFVDFTPTLQSWSFVLFDTADSLVASYFNSLVVGILSTLLTMAAASLFVYALTRQFGSGHHPWADWLLGTALATRVITPFVLVMPVYLLARVSGLLDSRTLLVVLYAAINLPVAMWLLRPVFGLRASEQEEAAYLEGASHLHILSGILVPMSMTGVAAAAVIVFLQCWNEYVFAATLAGNTAMTMPPFLVGQMSMKEAQVGGEAEEWAQFSAAAMLLAIPLLATTSLVQKALGRTVRR